MFLRIALHNSVNLDLENDFIIAKEEIGELAPDIATAYLSALELLEEAIRSLQWDDDKSTLTVEMIENIEANGNLEVMHLDNGAGGFGGGVMTDRLDAELKALCQYARIGVEAETKGIECANCDHRTIIAHGPIHENVKRLITSMKKRKNP